MRRLILILTIGILLTAIVPFAAWANSNAVLRPDPVSLGLRSGAQGTVSIRVENAQALYGIEFHLKFDPKVVQVMDADRGQDGVQLIPGDWFADGFLAVNNVDNSKGTIDYAVTLLNPAEPLDGSGTIATITFKARQDGTSPLKISKAILATREAD
jgi:hypothetical protein